MRKALWFTLAGVVMVGGYLLWVFGSRSASSGSARAPRSAAEAPAAVGAPAGVRISQFYAMPGTLAPGEKALVCYGVEEAESVRLDPPVETLKPASNRCFEVSPSKDTRYTLTATGKDGKKVAESFLIQVKSAAAADSAPRIVYFGSSVQRNEQGRAVTSLCFRVDNTEEVRIDPPVVPPIHGPAGCFYVSPLETTTYTLTAVGAGSRTAEKRHTVKVPEAAR